jgi:hypothetical protein
VGATCATFSARFRMLAIGTQTGHIYAYTVEPDHAVVFSHCMSPERAAAQHQVDLVAFETPLSISQLQYSPDGNVLLALHASGAVTLWSVFGAMLLSSASDGLTGRFPADYFLQSASWGPQGFYVIGLPTLQSLGSSSLHPGDFIEFNFMHSALTRNATLNNQHQVVLRSSEHLYLSVDQSPAQHNAPVDKVCELQWQPIPVQANYINKNWPIQFVSANDRGNLIAVAGRKGTSLLTASSFFFFFFFFLVSIDSRNCVRLLSNNDRSSLSSLPLNLESKLSKSCFSLASLNHFLSIISPFFHDILHQYLF